MINFILQLIAYAGGSVAIAYFLFVWLGKRIIEHWFATRMEAYKNAQSQELEDYKYKINALFNRVTKIHEKEFEVLPKAWELLQKALGEVGSMASPLQSFPDFRFMSDSELNEFLETTKLRKHEKEELKSSPNKNGYYQEKIFWHNLHDARSKIYDLHNYLLLNKIFLSKDLFEEFGKIDNLLFETAINIEQYHQHYDMQNVGDSLKTWQRLNEDSQAIAAKIENYVQERLHYTEVK